MFLNLKYLMQWRKSFHDNFFVFGDAIDVINLNRTFLQKPSYRRSRWFTSLALNLSDFLYQGILSPQIYRRTRPACTFGCFYFYEKLPLDSIFVLCNRINHFWGLLGFFFTSSSSLLTASISLYVLVICVTRSEHSTERK